MNKVVIRQQIRTEYKVAFSHLYNSLPRSVKISPYHAPRNVYVCTEDPNFLAFYFNTIIFLRAAVRPGPKFLWSSCIMPSSKSAEISSTLTDAGSIRPLFPFVRSVECGLNGEKNTPAGMALEYISLSSSHPLVLILKIPPRMLFSVFFLLAVFLQVCDRTGGPIVSLDYATFEGASTGGIDKFLGIPCAQPPVEDFRFRHPEPPLPLPGTTPVSNFSCSFASQVRRRCLISVVSMDRRPQTMETLARNRISPSLTFRISTTLYSACSFLRQMYLKIVRTLLALEQVSCDEIHCIIGLYANVFRPASVTEKSKLPVVIVSSFKIQNVAMSFNWVILSGSTVEVSPTVKGLLTAGVLSSNVSLCPANRLCASPHKLSTDADVRTFLKTHLFLGATDAQVNSIAEKYSEVPAEVRRLSYLTSSHRVLTLSSRRALHLIPGTLTL